MELEWSEIENRGDTRTSITAVPRSESVFDILKALDWKHFDYVTREENSLTGGLEHRCHCEHDCCGHLCYESFEITMTPTVWCIVYSACYNY